MDGNLLLHFLFLCFAFLPIIVGSFLIVGASSYFNVMLLCHPDAVCPQLCYLLVLGFLAALYLVYDIFPVDNTDDPK